MFNVANDTPIENIEKTGCTRGHILACINDRTMHETPKYSFFGKNSARGTMTIHTKNGDFTIAFKESRGWAEYVKVI